MDKNAAKLYKMLSEYVEIDSSEWELIHSAIDIHTFDKGEIILFEGDKKANIYIVLSGLLRTYFTRCDGEEKTFYFSLEGEFAADYQSALKGESSQYSIDALEKSTVAVIPIKALLKLYSTLRNGEMLGRIIVEKYFFIWSERISDFYMHSPLERYNSMCRLSPQLIQRVPQYYIASYLNISTVHLSRLKGQEQG